jgi:acyl-CoA synthetase (AMP-forming)/AMP-acid ligase II/thioesterase domain-containing protein
VNLHNNNTQNPLLAQFEQTVKAWPLEAALMDKDTQLTYKELWERCSNLASSLRSLQTKHDSFEYIPVYVSRDVESAVVVLTCLLYDFPFTPLDSDWPGERLAWVSTELQSPPFGLVPTRNSKKITGWSQSEVLDATISVVHSRQRLARKTVYKRSIEPGYVVFTSGTTGEPKGVEFRGIELQAKLASFASDDNRRPSAGSPTTSPEDSLTLIGYPLNFGAGLRRLCIVARGNSVYLLSQDEMEPAKFLHVARETKAKALNVPPSLLLVLSDFQNSELSEPYLPLVRVVSWGGDSISFDTASKLKRFFDPTTVCRAGFGATEGSSNLGLVFQLGEAPISGEMPLGTANMIPDHRRLPFNDSQNLFVLRFESPLATGYLNKPELSSERFRLDEAGDRYWISGDIVQIDGAGIVWHRGRIDDLVKIRGKLTSPSESAKALMEIPGVVDAFVMPSKTREHRTLVAHLAVSKTQSLQLREIKQALYAKLPSHLIPSQFFVHDVLPKNDRGKTDRKALEDGDFLPMKELGGFPPMTGTEITLHTHLEEILGFNRIPIDENLLNSGLDSLAGLELESRLLPDFPEVTLDLISQHSNIRSLAKALDQLNGNFSNRSVLNAGSLGFPIYAFPGGAGHRSTHFVHLANSLKPTRPVICFLSAAGDVSILNTTINGRVGVLLDEISSEAMTEVTIIGYSAGGALAYESARACAQRGIRVKLTVFDTGFGIMEAGARSTLDRLRLSRDQKSRNLSGLPKVFYLVRRAFSRHGIRRTLGLLFLVKPFETLTTSKTFRKAARIVIGNFPRFFTRNFKSHAFHSLSRQELADYSAQPLTDVELKYIDAIFFYTSDNKRYSEWKKLIPNIEFLKAEGSHSAMLKPPNVQRIAEHFNS